MHIHYRYTNRPVLPTTCCHETQQTSLVEETTPAALAISDTNVQAQQVSAVEICWKFSLPKNLGLVVEVVPKKYGF